MRAAFSMLLRALQTESRPFVTRVPVPLLLPGERSSTEDAPADGLYAGLAALEGAQVWRTEGSRSPGRSTPLRRDASMSAARAS